MNASIYRRIRIAVGALVFGFSTLAFADVGGWVSAAFARVGMWLQFTPSLMAFVDRAAWISAGCLAVLLLTLLFGRVYCAMLCPMGVLMDLSAWLAGRSGKKRKLPYRDGRLWLRVSVVILCVAGLLAGTAIPLGLLDPYSLFGKITAATIRPVAGEANHLLSMTGWFMPVKWSPVAPVMLGLALVMLAAVVITAILRGRLWCNTLCPVGAVLGFFSRHSLFRLHLSDSACVGCSMCERVCPSQCIDFKNHRIDHSRCVMCMACVTSCKRSGINLRMAGRNHAATDLSIAPATVKAMPAINRRLFLTSAAVLPSTVIGSERRRPVLPPGARSLAHFQNNCTACHLCVANCPDQVLRPSITAHGLAGFLQPWQDFSVSFCSYNCSNCSQACPTGAIQPISVEDRRTIRTGVARFHQDLCVVRTKGTSCGACNEHCPTQAVHMIPWKNDLTIPEVDADLCIGCGGCEFICPVRPEKAIVVHGLAVHERAKPVDRGKANTVREIEEEFPF